jgi:hypothetical protein
MHRIGLRDPVAAHAGQASVELVASIPLLVISVLLVVQLAIAGFGLWTASVSARAGARAALVGGRADQVSRRTLPRPLRHEARIRTRGPVNVRVTIPPVVPGFPRVRVGASTALTPSLRASARAGG